MNTLKTSTKKNPNTKKSLKIQICKMFPSKQYLKIQPNVEILHMGHDTLKNDKKFNQTLKN